MEHVDDTAAGDGQQPVGLWDPEAAPATALYDPEP